MDLRFFQKENECMPRDQIKELQSKRLKAQFKWAYENVEFYRNRCNEHGVTPSDV
ncbi:MAG: phenylacetate--CoA ligase, partial [Treponema sp.]|nr:phenylacetate--CoA ligase [Treponema sp.]